MFRTRAFRVVVWAGVLAACGCSGARCVALRPDGGVVAIPSNTNSWPYYYRDKAEALMREKCPQGYVVDHEEEVATGVRTTESHEADTSSIGAVLMKKQNTVTENHATHEWQISYRSN